jgi:hypothetical protein
MELVLVTGPLSDADVDGELVVLAWDAWMLVSLVANTLHPNLYAHACVVLYPFSASCALRPSVIWVYGSCI